MPYKRTGNPPGAPKKRPPERGRKPELTYEQWLAIEIEYQGFNGALEPWPSNSTLAAVAAASGKTTTTVWRWRRNAHYRQGLIWREVGQQPSMTFVDPAPPSEMPARTHAQSIEILKQYPEAHRLYPKRFPWSGSVTCVLCEEEPIFNDLEAYIEHMDTAHPDAVWIGDRSRR